jgi:damage-control phosphatase, subfamily I
MKTNTGCIPCFLRQAYEALERTDKDDAAKRKILKEVSLKLFKMSFDKSPPQIAKEVYALINKLTSIADPFKEEKKHSNELALKLYPELKKRVEKADDKLFEAVKLAAIGNIIDLGAKSTFDIEEELKEDANQKFAIFDYDKFKEKLEQTDKILYLGDNAGEIVFDKLLITQLKKPVIFAVRDKPVINDATIEDAHICGLDEVCEVISSGSDAPGAVLDLCNDGFLKIYNESSLIISKGQGNFEELSDEDKPIFFLFKAKCQAVADDLNCKVGDMILKRQIL